MTTESRSVPIDTQIETYIVSSLLRSNLHISSNFPFLNPGDLFAFLALGGFACHSSAGIFASNDLFGEFRSITSLFPSLLPSWLFIAEVERHPQSLEVNQDLMIQTRYHEGIVPTKRP